jgi:hypothetical protein
VQFGLKSVSNKGHFSHEARTVFRISPRIAVGSAIYVTLHSLRKRYVQCKLGSRRKIAKDKFLLGPEQFFGRYLHSHCSGVNPIGHIALLAHAFCSVQVRLKSVGNEGHFTLEAETLFRPHLPYDSSGVTNTAWYSLQMRYKQSKVGWRRSVIKDNLLLRSTHFFVRTSRMIAVGSLSNTAWYSQRMRCKQCKFGWRRTVMSGTLLYKPKVFPPYLP